ncbi:hypothetical protein KCU73_g6150, partial [Aureobasidium melanogenum]
IQANIMYDALTMTLPTDRSTEDEERVINGVKALVDATTDPPKEQTETLANSIQRSMSEVIELAFRRAEISEAITADVWRGPRDSRHHRKGDIERISAMVRINTSVRVNERTQYRISKNSIGPLVRETYEDSSSIAQGTFEIRTISRKTGDGKKVSLESVITFTASRTQYREFLLSMHLIGLYGSQGATVMPATIIMHEKISYNHPIFRAIVRGNYDTFTKLINERSARIWDRDPGGKSLLYYAITSSQIDVVKYLIQHGMDVCISSNMYTILSDAKVEAEVNGQDFPNKYRPLHDLFEIQRLLLEAGLDPQQEIAKNCKSPLDYVIADGTCVELKCFLDQSQYTISLSEEHFTNCAQGSDRDTWAKLRLLYSRGAMRDFKGNIRSHIFKCTLEQLHFQSNSSDIAQTLDILLECKVKESTIHHEQVDLDGQVQLSTADSNEAEYDLSHLFQDVAQFSRSTKGRDLIYCAVRRTLLRNDWYRKWMRQHPRKPSVYSDDYTPFHHLSLLRQKPSVPRTRAACPLGSDERISECRDDTDWEKRFSKGEWPDMSPQEESIIAHGALARHFREREWLGIFRWSPQGEIRIPDEELSAWFSDDCNPSSHGVYSNKNEVSLPPNEPHWRDVSPEDYCQHTDAADLNEVSSPTKGSDWRQVLERLECSQQGDEYMECHDAQDFELTMGHHDQCLPHLAQPNKLQEMHAGSREGYPAPLATKRRLSLTTELIDAAEGCKRPRLDEQNLDQQRTLPPIEWLPNSTLNIDSQSFIIPYACEPTSYFPSGNIALSGRSDTAGVGSGQVTVLPSIDSWFDQTRFEEIYDSEHL